MAASYVTVIVDRSNGDGSLVTEGSVTFSPGLEFPDPADQMLVGTAPVTREFGAPGHPSVRVIANDTAGPQGAMLPGWSWNVTYSGVPGSPQPASYYILSTNGSTQRLSALATVPPPQPPTWQPGTGIDGGTALTGQFPVFGIDGGSASG